MKFKALIDGVHIDPKKGTVKISLAVASHISLDELTTIGPKDESIWITLESEQTKLEPYPEEYAKRKEEEEIKEQERMATGAALEPGSQEERELKEGRIVTEFPTEEAEEVKATGELITLNEEAAAKLKEAADRLREGEVEGNVEGDEGEEGGQGGII